MIGFLRKHRMIAAVLAALIQCGILGYMIQSRASILQHGTEIVLKTEPVDPRDLLRGDYVTLGYSISQFQAADIPGDSNRFIEESTPIYLALKKGPDGIWAKSRASITPFIDLTPDEVLIRGRSAHGFTLQSSDFVRVNYGIERFYVPEGGGHAIESAQVEKRIDALVMVDAKGKAQMKALRDNGVALYEEPIY